MQKNVSETWKVYDEITYECLIQLSNLPLLTEINDDCTRKIERFVMLLYNCSSIELKLARKYCICLQRKGNQFRHYTNKTVFFEHLKE